MRIAAPPFISNHRLARLLTWARLWLAWAAGVLAQFVGALPESHQRGVRANLDQCAQLVARVIFLRAFARLDRLDRRNLAGIKRKEPAGSRRSGGGGFRAVIGSSLRRALRGKDARAKLAALADVVRNAEFHIAKLARRLARGLTRRRVFAFAPNLVPLTLTAPFARAASADTS